MYTKQLINKCIPVVHMMSSERSWHCAQAIARYGSYTLANGGHAVQVRALEQLPDMEVMPQLMVVTLSKCAHSSLIDSSAFIFMFCSSVLLLYHLLAVVTIFLLSSNIFLLIFSHCTYVLPGMCCYNYISCLLITHPFHSCLVILWSLPRRSSLLPEGSIPYLKSLSNALMGSWMMDSKSISLTSKISLLEQGLLMKSPSLTSSH